MTIIENGAPPVGAELIESPPDTGHVIRHDDSLNKMGALWELAQRVSNTDFARTQRGKPEAVFAAFMRGHEVGLEPFQSLDSIDVIQGTPTLKPEVMRALIRQQGHDYDVVEMSATRCTMRAHRKEWVTDRWSEYTFTIDDAKGLQLTGKDNWKKQPKVMLFARCTGLMARADFADVIRGLSYTPDEILDIIEVPATVRPVETSTRAQVPAASSGTVDMTAEIDKLTDDEKVVLREWWGETMPRADMPKGCKAGGVPEHRVQEVRRKLKEIIGDRGPDNDPDSATPSPSANPDDEIIEAEIVEEPGEGSEVPKAPTQGRTTRQSPTSLPALARDSQNPPGKDSWQEAMQQTCRSMGIDPAERNRLASKFLDRNVRRPSDMTDSEIGMFMDFLDTGDFSRVNKATETVANAFPGAEEVDDVA